MTPQRQTNPLANAPWATTLLMDQIEDLIETHCGWLLQ